MNKKQKGFAVLEGLLILVIVGLIAGVGWYVYDSKNKADKSLNSANSSSIVTPTAKKKATAKPTAEARGTITGTASYPSEGLPQDEEVCSVNVNDNSKVFCMNVGSLQKPSNNTGPGISSGEPVQFALKVPVGDYYVYAKAEKELPGYKAYYNEFAKCGNQVSCPNSGHKAYIKVTVTKGASVKADPSDWYVQ